MPDFIFKKSTGQYKYKGNHAPVSQERVSTEVDFVSRKMSDLMATISERLRAGQINDTEWLIQMTDTLRAGHRAVAIIAGGGKENMTPSDWGFVGAKIKAELAYLSNFAREVEARPAGSKLTTAFVSRARSYSQAIYPTYEQAVRRRHIRNGTANAEQNILDALAEHCDQCPEESDKGVVPIGTLVSIGDRLCGSRDRCRIEFSMEAAQ